jgi:hypothetical protein
MAPLHRLAGSFMQGASRMAFLVLFVLMAASPALASLPSWPDASGATIVGRHPDGTPKTLEIRHPDGRRTEFRTWPDGSRRWQFEYDPDRKEDGTCTRWHPSGAVFVEEHWQHGKRIGTWYFNNDDGSPNGRFIFENGREVAHDTWFGPEQRWIPFSGPKAFPDQ